MIVVYCLSALIATLRTSFLSIITLVLSLRLSMKIFKYPVYFLATIFILFEEWLWFRLLRLMKAFTALPLVRAIDPFVRRQNKWVSLALFAIPEVSFIPVKMAVFWLFGAGHAFSGVILFIAAKLAGTATFAWMWDMTEAKITEFTWVRWVRDTVLRIRGWAHTKLEASATYQEVKAAVIELRARLRKHKEHWLKRKFRASIAVAKNKV